MQKLAIIGMGAFGRLMLEHLAPHFELLLHDPYQDLSALEAPTVTAASLPACAAADIVVIATPVQIMTDMATALAPLLRAGTLVLDVGSVKVKPAQILAARLPDHVDIVCTHPLFGPQSAAQGLKDLKITLCPVRGTRIDGVEAFLSGTLGLQVIRSTPERHDRELAYVQGLTHLIGKTLLAMDLEEFQQTTVSYDLLRQAIGFIRHDSPELFRAIEMENPYALEARTGFFDAVRRIEGDLAEPAPPPALAKMGHELS